MIRVFFAFASLLMLGAVALSAMAGPGDSVPGDTETGDVSQQAQEQTRLVLPGLARNGPPDAFAYTVKAGDTLFSLAQRFGTTVDTLVTMNAIADPGDIPTGAVIFIPNVAEPTGPSLRVDHGSRDSNKVALTFDMGGRVEPALQIMQFLIDNDIKATIFPTGAIVESQFTDAGRQVLGLVEAHPALFDLGNHSYSHPDLTTLSAAEIEDELATTEAAFADYIDVSPRPLFRPPLGAVNNAVLEAVGDAGYAYTIMWDVDTIDWLPVADGGPTAQEMVNKVVNNAQGGTIVLMHLGGYNTLEALPGIIAGLEARGFEFATVGEFVGN